jgi:hypothetical protein
MRLSLGFGLGPFRVSQALSRGGRRSRPRRSSRATASNGQAMGCGCLALLIFAAVISIGAAVTPRNTSNTTTTTPPVVTSKTHWWQAPPPTATTTTVVPEPTLAPPPAESEPAPPPVESTRGGNGPGVFLCRDGTTSHASHRQGACSHHGGVVAG